MKPGWPVILGGALSICLTPAATFNELPQSTGVADQYLVSNLRTDDGLPDNAITHLAQTPDGFIWFGSFNGLARFDGVKVKVFDATNTPELPSSRITHLHVDARGFLWVTSEGGDLTRVSAKGFRRFTKEDGLTSPIHQFQVDAEGRMWAAHTFTNTDVFEIVNDRFIPRPGSRSFVERFGEVTDAAGFGWTDTPNGALRVGHNQEKEFPLGDEFLPMQVAQMVPGRHGGVWHVSDRGFFRLENERWELVTTNVPIFTTISSALEDDFGNVWVGSWGEGLGVLTADGKFHSIPTTDGARQDAIRDLLLDRDGNLWVATNAEGLFRFKKRSFRSLDSKTGLSADHARAVAEVEPGNYWISTYEGLDRVRMKGDRAQIEKLVTSAKSAWNLLRARNGVLWLGTYDFGLARIEGGSVEYFKEPGENPGYSSALFEDSTGLLWVGTSKRLMQFTNNALATVAGLPLEGPTDVRGFAEGTKGEIYVALNRGGLLMRKEGHWRRFTRADGLSSDDVFSLAIDHAGVLWIGTAGGGICRYANGQFTPINDQALPKTTAYLVEDDEGCLWIGSANGVFRVPLRDLNHFADGRSAFLTSVRFDRSDGMPSSACLGGWQPSAFKSSDGKLWFPTYRGLALLNPKEINSHSLPPHVQIEALRIDNSAVALKPIAQEERGFSRFAPSDFQAVIVPAGSEQLEIEFLGLNYAAPERVRFRYRLEGHDSDWVDVGGTRAARYSRLKPGTYTFRVAAVNQAGIWNHRGAALQIVALPHLWETAWFRGLIVMAAGVLLIVAYRRALGRQNQIATMRLRIASDLHDEVGSNLGSIALKTELLQSRGTLPAPDRRELADINSVALQTAHDVRDVAWFINPDFDTLDEMRMRMRDVAARLLDGREWSFDDSEAGADRALSLEFRRNVFFIFKEILHNILRHSGARKVKIKVFETKGDFCLEVADDGRGIEVNDGSGQGRRNMERRAAALGGRMEVRSETGCGTTVWLKVPAPRKFVVSKWRNALSRARKFG
jgi:ligand-binding sensor domain-containing protein/signal transduction histidine kinase